MRIKVARFNLLRKKVNDFFFYVYDSETDTTVPVPVEDLAIEDEQELEFIYDDKVRKVWNAKEEEWYFSIIDVCEVLTDSIDARKYWNKLKQRLSEEGNETVTNCHQLKMKASDGKMRKTDCANTEQLLRIIQSIPSKKAEPFKQWLAKVGAERLDEIANPELAIERAVQTYISVLADFTVEEVIKIGEYLCVPEKVLYKKPNDGLSNQTDEDKLGVKYSEIADYMEDKNSVPEDVAEKIENLHIRSRHKFNIPTYRQEQ